MVTMSAIMKSRTHFAGLALEYDLSQLLIDSMVARGWHCLGAFAHASSAGPNKDANLFRTEALEPLGVGPTDEEATGLRRLSCESA